MQITFNPLDKLEAAAVLRMLAPPTREMVAEIKIDPAPIIAHIDKVIAEADRPDVGAPAQSAIPLPPSAPSPAAADLFGTAPEVPTAGIPLPPGAELPPVPPVPPTPPVAPPAPAAPTSPAPAAELDKDGLPWHHEIHSGERGKNKDGTWRKKRNLDPAKLAEVTAQLRGSMAIPPGGAPLSHGATPASPAGTAPATVPSVPPVPPVPSATEAAVPMVPTPPAGDTSAAGNVPQAPSQPPVPPSSAPATAPIPTPPAATAAPASTAPVTFAGVLKKVTEGLRERKFTEDRVNEMLASIGVQKIGLLAARPDLVQALDAIIEAE